VEQINYTEEFQRLLSAYRSNSFEPGENDLRLISTLIDRFPFSQSLYFIQAAFLKDDTERFESSLFKAALRTAHPETLYQTIHHPDKFILTAALIPEVKKEIKAEKIAEPVPEVVTEEIDYSTLSDTSIISPAVETRQETLSDDTISEEHFILNKPEAAALQDESALPKKEPAQNNVRETNLAAADTQKVSRYNDDTLPYTFLWWLNKTRKEHNENYQPYVDFKLDTSRPIKQKPDQLNQQIIENIFHLNTPFENSEKQAISGHKTVEFELKKKEDEIIEKFIKQDPQIRPMPAEKIDTENKARKSAEDSYDLVSETLANIYTEQMLFHKAIDTYKKLSLKFPEKNAYFADQISELEKRNN
jgi:hypothetical protein